MKYVDIKKCFAVLSTGVVLSTMSGCASSNERYNNETQTHVVTAVTNAKDKTTTIKEETTTKENTTTKQTTTTVEQTTTEETTETVKETETAVEESKDEVVIGYFTDLKEDVKKYVNKENFDAVKDKTIDSLITLTDFIFYGTEIKGVTFDQLKDETKQIIVDSFLEVDELIMLKFPDYKEVFTDKAGYAYDTILNKIIDLKNKGKEKIVSKIGEEKYDEYLEKYNRVKEEYDEVMDNTKEDVEEVKQHIKKWYENKTGK